MIQSKEQLERNVSLFGKMPSLLFSSSTQHLVGCFKWNHLLPIYSQRCKSVNASFNYSFVGYQTYQWMATKQSTLFDLIVSQHLLTWATNFDSHGQLQNSFTFEPISNSNIPSFASSGSFYPSIARLWDLVEILYGLLLEQGQESAAQRLYHDTHYKLLHDRVMEVLAEQLKSDIDTLKQHRLKMELEPEDNDKLLLVSQAAECCTPSTPEEVQATCAVLMFESLGRILFPQESDQSEEWERLRKEFLEPLTEYSRRRTQVYPIRVREPLVVKKYLEEVKAGGSIIKSDALLPNDIIRYVKDKDVGEAAEIQWKAMMKNMYQGENKFKNCLAVCNITYAMSAVPELAASLGILVSELSEEPAWKGKVITLGPLPDKLPLLHSIQGSDLKSRYDFVISTCSNSYLKDVDFDQVCDLILEVAVNNNLKAEQMIKKVFVLTDSVRFGGCSTSWKTLYEAKRSKFKEHGYGDDAMPHILFWNIWDFGGFMPRVEEPHPGVTLLRGNPKTLIKSFLDNGGEIDQHRLLEAAIADKEYQTLSVVD